LLFLLLYFEISVFAKEIGEKLDLTPTVEVQELYDSNVFKLKDEKTAQDIFEDKQMYEFLTVYSAGLKLYYPFKKQSLLINGKKEFVHYSHFKYLDFEKENVAARAVFNIGDGFFLKPNYRYSNKNIPRLYNIDQEEEDFLKGEEFGLTAGYEADKWKLSGTVKKEDHDYQINDNIDREEDSIGGTFTLTPSEDSQFYFKYIYRELKFFRTADENDNRLMDLRLGTTLAFGGKSKLQLEGGRREKTFSFAKDKDFVGFIGDCSFWYQLTEEAILSIGYSRSTETSFFQTSTFQEKDSIKADFSWQATSKICTSFSSSYDWINYKGLSGSDPLRWQSYLTLGWGMNYLPYEYLLCSLHYEYQHRDSNHDRFEFQANLVMLGLTLSWK
jgi:hypothetical protein